MIFFGIISSVFDYLTFAVLLLILKADPILFRTGWFVESVISASMVVLVIRSRRPFFKSAPSRYLLGATVTVVVAALALPFTPLGAIFGFVPLPMLFVVLMLTIVGLYIVAAELIKRMFYRRAQF